MKAKIMIIQYQADASIVKHHLKTLDVEHLYVLNDCELEIKDDYLYTQIREFLKKTKIKTKIKKKDI